jgi:hypothetical protein
MLLLGYASQDIHTGTMFLGGAAKRGLSLLL